MVLIMVALLVSGLSMNVFAGTGENGVIEASYDVISIQGNSTHCMKKGDQFKLIKALGEGAKFKGFVSENPDVATVNKFGTVTAVGAGETTITAKAKLKGSNKIYTATCRVYVAGLVAESIDVNGADSTVKGTAYGTYGKKVVDGKVKDVGIGDFIDVDTSNSSKLIIKGTVVVQNGGQVTLKNGDKELEIQAGGTLNVNSGGQVTIDSYSIYVNVEEGGLTEASCFKMTIFVEPGT